MEPLAKTVNRIQLLTNFAKGSVLDPRMGSEFVSDNTKSNLGAMQFISQNNQVCNISRFLSLLI